MSKTAGGIYLIARTKELVINILSDITRNYKTKTHSELITSCADLNANLSLYQLFTNIPDQIEAITKLLEEVPEEKEIT